jgi:hypothetical protein
MLNMSDVLVSADMLPPQAFTIRRSMGRWAIGGFQSATFDLEVNGPVQAATDTEIAMLPEADRIGDVTAFWSVQPIYVTRGKAPVPNVQGATLQGAIPGTVYTLSPAPPTGVVGTLTKNGSLLIPNVDYALATPTITLAASTSLNDVLYFEWPVNSPIGADASDILVYDKDQYRVLSVRHYPGSGYWKALGTRMSAV